MKERFALTFRPLKRDGGDVLLAGKAIAEIRNLWLKNVKLRLDGPSILGDQSGLPLYWRQYAGHQDPEKSARYRGRIDIMEQSEARLRLQVRSSTRSGDLCSHYSITFRQRNPGGSVEIRIRAQLMIPHGRTWRVTPNPDHGEVTFCTLWPAGVFRPDGSRPKRFQCCLLKRKSGPTLRIPHHHLESGDKHNLHMSPGDRFYWGVESHNPMFELLSGQNVEAGLCAYMWDAHFGLRLGLAGQSVDLLGPFRRSVSFRLRSSPRAVVANLLGSSRSLPLGSLGDTPVYHGGLHRFDQTFGDSRPVNPAAWPWQTCIVAGDPGANSFGRDKTFGHNDCCSLRIFHRQPAHGQWKATTLGPAFGETPFSSGVRLKLAARIRTRDVKGFVWISIRLHRPDGTSVYELSNYDSFESRRLRRAEAAWRKLELITPPMDPPPDRVHLLLQFEGRGTVWFDDVELGRIPG